MEEVEGERRGSSCKGGSTSGAWEREDTPGLMYHTRGIGGGLLLLSRVVNFSEEDEEEEQPP